MTTHLPSESPHASHTEKLGKKVKTCTRCILDDSIAGVKINKVGECNHCEIHNKLDRIFPTGEEGDKFLKKMADQMKRAGRNSRFDCLVGLSGGRDTSYCLYKTKQLGLRPLAVHFDNGWDSPISKRNIMRICQKLDVELHCVIADWEESRDLTNCTIRAGVPYIDLTDDIGIIAALYRTAEKENIKWIIHSHSYRTEGINPLKWNYVDARYVRSLINRFATMKYKYFFNPDLHHVFYWMIVRGIKVFTITNFYKDSDPEVDAILKRELGWEDTGGWHYDNEIFGLQCYYSRIKFGIDWRVVELAARVREGMLTREEALKELSEVPTIEQPKLVKYALKKQNISEEEFAQILESPPKFFTDYPSYYPIIRMLRWPIWLLSRLHFAPPHTYEKFFEV